jgi:peroxiredoxin
MKKKIVKFVIGSIVFSIFILLGILGFKSINNKKMIAKTIQTFHDFCTFCMDNNREFCTDSLPKQPIVLLFIHPECDFCHEEIKQLKESQILFQNISVLLVTTAPRQQVIDFYSNQNLSAFDNIKLLMDDNLKIFKEFDVNTIPTVFLYDEDKKLIFKHKGEIKMEYLIKQLREK